MNEREKALFSLVCSCSAACMKSINNVLVTRLNKQAYMSVDYAGVTMHDVKIERHNVTHTC